MYEILPKGIQLKKITFLSELAKFSLGFFCIMNPVFYCEHATMYKNLFKKWKKKKKKTGQIQHCQASVALRILFALSLFFIPSMPFLFSTPPNPILTENASDEALGLYYSLSLSRKR